MSSRTEGIEPRRKGPSYLHVTCRFSRLSYFRTLYAAAVGPCREPPIYLHTHNQRGKKCFICFYGLFCDASLRQGKSGREGGKKHYLATDIKVNILTRLRAFAAGPRGPQGAFSDVYHIKCSSELSTVMASKNVVEPGWIHFLLRYNQEFHILKKKKFLLVFLLGLFLHKQLIYFTRDIQL